MSIERTFTPIVESPATPIRKGRNAGALETTKAWLGAASLKTMATTAAPPALGAALSYFEGAFKWKIFLLTIFCFSIIHVIGNMLRLAYAKAEYRPGEYYDPQRAPLSPLDLKIAAFVLTIIVAGFGCIIALLTGKAVLAIGFFSLLFAYIAAGGPFPIPITPTGRAVVYVLFGISAALGAYYANSMHIAWNGVLLSIAPGLLGAALYDARNLDSARKSDRSSEMESVLDAAEEEENIKFLGAAVIFVYLIIILLSLSLSRWEILFGFASAPYAVRLLRYSPEREVAEKTCYSSLANGFLIVTSLALGIAFVVF